MAITLLNPRYAKEGDAIKSIARSGTTFTATRADGTTFTFTQQDNNDTMWTQGAANVAVQNFSRFSSGQIGACRYGRLVLVSVFGQASFSAWEDNVRVCTLSGVSFTGNANVGLLYVQDGGRCLQLFGSGNGVYVRNKNGVNLSSAWMFGHMEGLSST